jgi:hypothetical protein
MRPNIAPILAALTLGLTIGLSSVAQAQDTSTGSLTVTGTVASSIGLTIESAGGVFSGGGTAAASSALGNISKNGAAPTGFTRVNTATDSTLSSSVGIKVVQTNGASATYTLTAQLSAAPPTGATWTLGGLTVTAGAPVQLTATGVYAATPTYVWTIRLLDTIANATSIANTINFAAIAN